MRRRDNLKKLVLRFVAFPGMSGLEQAWLEATEMSADDAAVATEAEALDLAAALIKLSRIASAEAPADLTAALVHLPGSLMNARVERLIVGARPASTKPTGRSYTGSLQPCGGYGVHADLQPSSAKGPHRHGVADALISCEPQCPLC